MIPILILATATGVIAVAMLQRPNDRSVGAFAKTYAVPLTPGNVDHLRRYIWWARCWRTGGAVTMLLIVNAVRAIRNEDLGFDWYGVVSGYAFGAMLGEFLRPKERHPTRSVATLEQRRIADYVSPWFLVWAATVVVGALASATFLLLHPAPGDGWFMYAPNSDTGFDRLGSVFSTAFVAAMTAVVVAVAAGSWYGVHRMVQAPVPPTSADRQAVHHAIRTAAILSVAGGAVLAIGGIGARFATEAAMSDGNEAGVVQWGLNLSLLMCAVGALWGALLTLTAVPRFAPFAGPLPDVPSSA